MKKKKSQDLSNYIYALAAVVFFAALAIGISVFEVPVFENLFNKQEIVKDSTQDQDKKLDTKNCKNMRHLDGLCLEKGQDQYVPLVAVMIENHVDSRPQSGLIEASVVYEAPVEANYSRFLALYPLESDVEKAGPVRSSRPYFLDWVQEYGKPLYMHVGGSPDALDKIKVAGVLSINEMTKGWFFWRDKIRYAPHNTYTSSKLWQEVYKDYEEKVIYDEFTPWAFDNKSDNCEDSCVNQIDVTFLAPNYTVTWEYNKELVQYERKQGKVFHTDLEGRLIVADTIIVQHVSSRVLDAIGRQEIDTIGSGQVEIYRNGFKIIGTWKKESETGRTNWFDAKGDPISLKSGKIWIEIVNQRGLAISN